MLITTIDQVREHVPDVGNMIYENLKSHLIGAETKLRRQLGRAIFTLIEGVDDDSTDEMKEVAFWAKNYCSHFAVYKRLPTSSILLGDNGAQVSWSDTHRPAQDWQLNNFKYGILDGLHTAWENLFEALNEADPTEWQTHPLRLTNKNLFIQNSDHLSGLFPDINSRFFALISGDIEREHRNVIRPILGNDYYNELLEKLNSNLLSFDELKIVERIRYIVAKSVYSRAIQSLSEEDFPVSFLKKIDNQDKDTISSIARRDADQEVHALTLYISSLQAPTETHEYKPSNANTELKTFKV